MMSRVTNCIFSFFILSSFGCNDIIQKPEIISFKNPKITDLDNEKFSLEADLNIYNPNWFDLSAQDLDYYIYLDSLLIGRGNIDGKLVLENEDTTSINNSSIINKNAISELIKINNKTSLNLVGSFIVPFINYRYYYSTPYVLDINKIINSLSKSLIGEMKVDIKELEINSIELSSTDISVKFEIISTVDLDYNINKLSVIIFKDDIKNSLGVSNLNNEFKIKGNSSNIFESDVEINNLKMGSALLSNIADNDLTLSLQINSEVEYSGIILPISTIKKIKFNPRSRKIELI